jgi:predicted transcriptional regulator
MNMREKLEFYDRLTCCAELLPLDTRVAWRLLSYANHETGCAWPAVETLATEVKANERSVRRSLKRLVETGWFQSESGKGRGRTSRYWPNLVRIEGRTEEDVVAEVVEDKPENRTPVSAKGEKPDIGVRPSQGKNRTSASKKPDKTDRKTGHPCPTIPLNNPKINPNARARDGAWHGHGIPLTKAEEAVEGMCRLATGKARPVTVKALLGRLSSEEMDTLVTEQLAGRLTFGKLNSVLVAVQHAERRAA